MGTDVGHHMQKFLRHSKSQDLRNFLWIWSWYGGDPEFCIPKQTAKPVLSFSEMLKKTLKKLDKTGFQYYVTGLIFYY
jgi:hypothetical protein